MQNQKIIWDQERISRLKELKENDLTNKEIAEELNTTKYSVDNACHIFRVLLSPEKLRQKRSEAGKKGASRLRPYYKERGQLHSFDADLGYILGVLLGDGSMTDRGTHGSIQLKTTNKSFAMFFFRTLVNYGANAKYHVRKYDKTFKKGNKVYKNVIYYEIFYNSIYFVNNIKKTFGLTSTKEWKIDVDYVISLGVDFCRALTKGLFDSEGCFSVGKRVMLEFSTTNKKGAESFHLLLSKLGFDFRLNKAKRDGFYEYKIRTRKKENILKFYDEIGFSVDYKQDKLEGFVKNKIKNN